MTVNAGDAVVHTILRVGPGSKPALQGPGLSAEAAPRSYLYSITLPVKGQGGHGRIGTDVPGRGRRFAPVTGSRILQCPQHLPHQADPAGAEKLRAEERSHSIGNAEAERLDPLDQTRRECA